MASGVNFLKIMINKYIFFVIHFKTNDSDTGEGNSEMRSSSLTFLLNYIEQKTQTQTK